MDAPRKLLVDTLTRRPDLDLKNLSLAIGRNHAYLQQYLMRGSPRELPEGRRATGSPRCSAYHPMICARPRRHRRRGNSEAAYRAPANAPTCRSTPRPRAGVARSS